MFFTDTWRPDSFYDRIAANRKLGLHTLCLLDIKVKEPSLEALARGRTVYEAPRCAPLKITVNCWNGTGYRQTHLFHCKQDN